MIILYKFLEKYNNKLVVAPTTLYYKTYYKINLLSSFLSFCILLGVIFMRKFNEKSNICGKIIENARLSQNLSREDLAQKLQLLGLSVDRSFIYRIEKQNSVLKDFELIAICEILNLDLEKLKKLIKKDNIE